MNTDHYHLKPSPASSTRQRLTTLAQQLPRSCLPAPKARRFPALHVLYYFLCLLQYLWLLTLFRHLWPILVSPRQIPKKNKISQWFNRRYTVDLPLPSSTMSFCWRVTLSSSALTSWRVSLSSSALTSGRTDFSSGNFMISKSSISMFSPGLPVCELKQKTGKWQTGHPYFFIAPGHVILHSLGCRFATALFSISLT